LTDTAEAFARAVRDNCKYTVLQQYLHARLALTRSRDGNPLIGGPVTVSKETY